MYKQGSAGSRWNSLPTSLELGNYPRPLRARNNGRSTDNVQTDWGVVQSTFRLAGHVDRSQSIVLKTIVISMWRVAVHCETLIWNPGWNTTTTVVYNSRIETDNGVHALSVTKLKIFSLLRVKQQLKGVWSVAEKKVKFRGIFREIRRKIGWYRGNFAEISGLTTPKNNR